ncbi:MAG: hypothetical protein OEQ53_21530 [Saprospiraceae bacterium]|nr:hypothetical protein [Saprospiraceae bacterium]
MKKQIILIAKLTFLLLSFFFYSFMTGPGERVPDKVTLKLVKRAKVNKSVYKTLKASLHGQGLKMLGDMTIAPKPGFLLYLVKDANVYLNIPRQDDAEPQASIQETPYKIIADKELWIKMWETGDYFWTKCVCPNINDACQFVVDENGGINPNACDGPECCKAKAGYVGEDGKGEILW